MSNSAPTPTPFLSGAPQPARRKTRRWHEALLFVAFLLAIVIAMAAALRIAGVWQHYRVPTGAMAPAIQPGDCVFVTQLDATAKAPPRGTIVVFRTDHIPALGRKTIFVKRVVGLPGETVAIRNGQLLINGVPTSVHNAAGEITYQNLGELKTSSQTLLVPADSCFVLGDTSSNSFDSRFFGPIPRSAVIGQVRYRYLPLNRAGEVK